MLLTVDVGNTNVKLGVFNDGVCETIWRLSTGQRRTADEVGLFICDLMERNGFKPEIEGAIISSVVPDVMYSLTRGIQKYFNVNPLIVNPKMKMNLKFERTSPNEIGADRLVNCVAARAAYPGRPVIIVDYGTAVKYDLLGEDGEFVTGITAPGVEISAQALFEKAALIGKTELAFPPSIVVANTAESIQAGVLFGKIGEAEYIVSRLKRELALTNAVTIATGGFARAITPGTDIFDDADPFLTLKGLNILYETNK